jgi:hypothetical protein
MVMGEHPAPFAQPDYTLSNSGYHAHCLMAKDGHRRRVFSFHLFKVGPAKAACLHIHEDLAWAGDRGIHLGQSGPVLRDQNNRFQSSISPKVRRI